MGFQIVDNINHLPDGFNQPNADMSEWGRIKVRELSFKVTANPYISILYIHLRCFREISSGYVRLTLMISISDITSIRAENVCVIYRKP